MSVLIFVVGILTGYVLRQYQVRATKKQGFALANSALLVELDRAAGFAEWNLSDLSIRASTRQASLYGLEPRPFEGQYQQYQEFVHPDYRVRLHQAIDGALADGSEFELDFCVVIGEEERWLRSKGKVWIEAGQSPKLIEVTQDITRWRNLQEAHRKQEIKWRKLMENRVELVATLDENNCFAFINSTIESVLGFSPSDLIGQDFLTFVHPDDRDHVAQTLHKIHRRDSVSSHISYRFRACHEAVNWDWVESVASDERSAVGGIVLRTCKSTRRSSLSKVPRSARSQ